MMNADEARRFVAGKVFAFTCFDGTRGAGRILDDMGAAGAVQFTGAGPVRHIRLPGNTLQIRGQAVCASIKGIPFEPCFNLDKTGRGQLPRLGLGHGLRLLRFPSPGRGADADGARGGAAAFAPDGTTAARGCAHRSVRARGNPAGREREDRAGQIGNQGRACESRAGESRKARRNCAVPPSDIPLSTTRSHSFSNSITNLVRVRAILRGSPRINLWGTHRLRLMRRAMP